MNAFIKKYFYKLFKKIVPELSILKWQIDWKYLTNYSNDSIIASKASITSPYNLQNIEIGPYSYVSANSRISDTSIGKFCSIGPNLLCGWGIHPTHGISTSPMFYSTKKQNGYSLSETDTVIERRRVKIGNDVFIGANVTILDGVNIADGAVIGAGAVVSKDIPPYAIAVGSPIQILKYRFSEAQIADLQRIKWWDFPDEQLTQVQLHFFDVDAFIEKHGL